MSILTLAGTSRFRRPVVPALLAAALMIPATGSAAALAWKVDKAQSHLGFETVVVGQGVEGTFKRWDAAIALDPKALAAATMHVSVDVASADTGNEERDVALPSETWFNATRFAQATFDSRSIKQTRPGEFQATGTLTIRGVAKPLVLPFRFDIAARAAHMTSTVEINRSDFGVGGGEFVSGDTVALEVTIKVDLKLTQAE